MASVFNNLFHTIFLYIASSIFSFLKMFVLFLIFTMIIATITLIERKVLALLQRRVGPNYIGYKGRLQFIADAFKMLLKHIAIIKKVNKPLFIVVPAMVFITSYLFWANIVWGPNLAICEIEYNVLFLCISSSSISYLLAAAGLISNSKYATLSAWRILAMGLVIELLLTFLLLLLSIISSSLSFMQLGSFQFALKWNIFILFPCIPLLIVTFFLETARIPFDLPESESELVAGHTTEFGGFYFALFYLAEYFHLFCFSLSFVLILLGPWN